MSGQWYYTKNSQQQGPVSEQELKRMAQAGELKPSDLVWSQGMSNWVPAQSVKMLYPQQSATSALDAFTTKERSGDAPAAAPRRRRRIHDSEDDNMERRPRRSRKKKSSLWLWLVLGGVGCLFFCLVSVGVGIWWIASGSSSEGTRRWSLNTNQAATYHLYFRKGHRVEIKVISTGQSDIDLFVYDGNRKIAWDERTDSNCLIRFDPLQSRSYKVEVVNRDLVPQRFRNGRNSGTLEYRQIKLSDNPPPVLATRDPIGPPIGRPPIGHPPIGNVGGKIPAGKNVDFNFNGRVVRGQEAKHRVRLQANTTYRIDLQSTAIDCYLTLKNDRGMVLRIDDDGGIGLNSRIVFRPATTGFYDIYCRDLTKTRSGSYRLTVSH